MPRVHAQLPTHNLPPRQSPARMGTSPCNRNPITSIACSEPDGPGAYSGRVVRPRPMPSAYCPVMLSPCRIAPTRWPAGMSCRGVATAGYLTSLYVRWSYSAARIGSWLVSPPPGSHIPFLAPKSKRRLLPRVAGAVTGFPHHLLTL